MSPTTMIKAMPLLELISNCGKKFTTCSWRYLQFPHCFTSKNLIGK